MAIKRIFVPFGELKPDGKQFNNDGLIEARNVVPVHGGYVASQLWINKTAVLPAEPLGLHPHFTGTSWVLYYGDTTKLWHVPPGPFPWVPVDKSRLVGGAYGAASSAYGWQGTSFGDAIVMTDYVDDPQLLTSPTAANFVKLAQSGAGNPGMDPKAKFAYPVRGNLNLANLNLAAGFDGLPSGANPTVVVWSQSENIRQYGSYNVTPQLTGTGYQPLSYDFGEITGGVGGDYGLIAMQNGWVRQDGPPYTFRPIVIGTGCRFPNSIVRFDRDTYFWGPSGPSVLRGGEGPVEVLGQDRIVRTLLDNTTGFSPAYSINSTVNVNHVSAAIDSTNGLVMFSFTSVVAGSAGTFSQVGDLTVVYSTSDGRFSFIENRLSGAVDAASSGVPLYRSGPDLGTAWAPGRDLVGALRYNLAGANAHVIAIPKYSSGGAATPVLARAFQQLDPQLTTRIRRVRPVFSLNDPTATVSPSVFVASKNRPYESGTLVSSAARDTHGWLTTPDSLYADFHQVSITLDTLTVPVVAEMEGYEAEFETGGAYSA